MTVGTDEDVEFGGLLRQGEVALLRTGREQRQDLLKVVPGAEGRLDCVRTAGDDRALRAHLLGRRREALEQVVGGVGERGEDQRLSVVGVDRVGGLVLIELLESLELDVVVGVTFSISLASNSSESLAVMPQVALPGLTSMSSRSILIFSPKDSASTLASSSSGRRQRSRLANSTSTSDMAPARVSRRPSVLSTALDLPER